jgi:hypothetical protein
VLLNKDALMSEDNERKQHVQLLETLIHFTGYTGVYINAPNEKGRRSFTEYYNRSTTFSQLWKKTMHVCDCVIPYVQKGKGYLHVDTDAAICLFPETTSYPLITAAAATRVRPCNQTSEHLISDWLIHKAITAEMTAQALGSIREPLTD